MGRRFTLVELMIVVAIIAILAAIAIPALAHMQLRAKRAELLPNVDGIRAACVAYEAVTDLTVSSYGAAVNPDTVPGKTARAWDGAVAGWANLGWAPDGDVRGSYEVTGFGSDGACPIDIVDLPSSNYTLTCMGAQGNVCINGLSNLDVSTGRLACAFATTAQGAYMVAPKLVSGPDTY